MEGDTSQNEKDLLTIPYFVHEGEMTRLERNIKRQTVIIFILLAVLAFMVYESYQFEYAEETTTEFTQDGEGLKNINVGEQGDINGKTDSEDNEEAEQNDGAKK